MIAELRKQLEDEIRKQKLSSESLLDELRKESDRKIS